MQLGHHSVARTLNSPSAYQAFQRGQIQPRQFDSDDRISLSQQPYIPRGPDEQVQHADAKYPLTCGITDSQNCVHTVDGVDIAVLMTYVRAMVSFK